MCLCSCHHSERKGFQKLVSIKFHSLYLISNELRLSASSVSYAPEGVITFHHSPASHFLTSSFYPFSMIMYFSHNNVLTTLRCLATAPFTQLPSFLLPSTSFSSRPLFQLSLWSYLSLLDFRHVNSKTPPQAYPNTVLYAANHTDKSD